MIYIDSYRSRIGGFSQKLGRRNKNHGHCQSSSENWVIFLLFFMLVSSKTPEIQKSNIIHLVQSPSQYYTTPISYHLKHHCLPPSNCLQQKPTEKIFSISTRQRNKEAHIINGNRGARRGISINICYWNKGSADLQNRKDFIAEVINKEKPHALGIGEAQFKEGHDLDMVQQPGYKLHLGPCLATQGASRVAVYTHESLTVKRRTDLEDPREPLICLQLGKPRQKGILLLCGYRQWSLPGAGAASKQLPAQLERWEIIVSVWEEALREGREVVCMMDANLNSLEWDRLDEMSSREYEYQFKPLVESLFERIISLGTTMIIKKATRSWQGKVTKCLDHIYTSQPSKMGEPEVVWTGLSDHALVKVQRYTKSLEKKQRYIRKRCYKTFDKVKYKEIIKEMT